MLAPMPLALVLLGPCWSGTLCFGPVAFGAAQDWIPLELPQLCTEREAGAWIPPLEDGRHVRLERREVERRSAPSAELSGAQLAQVLETEARRRGRPLAVYAATPPLLVQGSEEDAAWARAFLRSLDQAAARLSIELEASLVPAIDPAASGDVLAPPDPSGGGGSWRARARSGDEVTFGERVHHRFVASFDVEVASNSGVAAPVIGSVLTGSTVHVRAARVAGGRKISIVGLLDLAELVRWEEFDPDSIDLGVVQQPVVASVQVAFSGVVESGGALTVSVRGAPLGKPDWTLRLSATTTPDPAEVEESDWRIMDLAFLTGAQRSLGAFALGTGLDALIGPERPAGQGSAVTPSALLLRAESQRRTGARAPTPGGSVATEHALLLPGDEHETWRDLMGLARAMESSRLATTRVALASGGLEISLPIAGGEVARVLVGTERTWLVDYESQIAPDTWMPSPRVERAFDGIVWQAHSSAGVLECSAAESRTLATAVRTQTEAYMGTLQLPSRSLRVGRSRSAPSANGEVLLEATASAPSLVLRLAPE